ncbi:hypothetical protein Poly30_53090 [Planctomycetes bacterium Poly30]|uniref:Carboxypeptidase regulatory-like domain-containing protein n=1 Tax=Saltatorellus ferox TaxID=2528018 RepID=A0A518F087_9BACT|nr:hypothetical protein Poly30_53090 [Planctomycetes bacterium Poly30]
MKLSTIIPLASLAIVGTVLAIGALHDTPLGMEFTVPPRNAEIEVVDLGLGDLTLRGILVDGEGQPVPEAGVTTEQAGRPVWAWSRRDGTFELGDLRPGPLLLRVVALGFEASQFEVALTESTPAGETRTFQLDRPIGAPPEPPVLSLADLDGTVRFGPLATPELGYELLFQPVTAPTDPAGGFPRRAPVAPDGSFHVDLLHAGRYRAILLSPDDRGATEPDLLQTRHGEPRTFTHEAGGDTPRLDLVATMGAVTGRVYASSRDEGLAVDLAAESASEPDPVRGALVKIERVSADEDASEGETVLDRVTFRATRSAQDGRFELHDLLPGSYRLTLVAGRERRTVDMTVPAGEVATIDIDLSR